jgi:Integrase zinc binding domain
VRVIAPPELREKELQKVHGSKARGHWGILRTAAMVRAKYYWKGWAADVMSAVAKCMACEIVRLKKPGRQGRIMKYHPSRLFELVAVDIPEMTPVTRRGNKKNISHRRYVQSFYHGGRDEGRKGGDGGSDSFRKMGNGLRAAGVPAFGQRQKLH